MTGAAASWCCRLGDVAQHCRRLLGFPLTVLDCRTTGCRLFSFNAFQHTSPPFRFSFLALLFDVLTVLLPDRRFPLIGGWHAVVHSAAQSPLQQEDLVRPQRSGVWGAAGGDWSGRRADSGRHSDSSEVTGTVVPWGALTHLSQRCVGGVVDGGGGEQEGEELWIKGRVW
mgnify:CR=1 FL=1